MNGDGHVYTPLLGYQMDGIWTKGHGPPAATRLTLTHDALRVSPQSNVYALVIQSNKGRCMALMVDPEGSSTAGVRVRTRTPLVTARRSNRHSSAFAFSLLLRCAGSSDEEMIYRRRYHVTKYVAMLVSWAVLYAESEHLAGSRRPC
jgi:hypothetical protein